MAGFLSIFKPAPVVASVLPIVWEMQLRSALYTEIQLRAIYTRILSEVLSRSHSIPDAFRPLLRDSMEGEGQRGLIEHIVRAMVNQNQLILKYEAGMLHVPEYMEREKIVAGWKSGNKPPRTLMLSFQNYDRTTMLRQLLLHKYLLLCTQHKALNLSTALLIKMSEMRASVGLSDSNPVLAQASEIARALLDGKPALLDAKDAIEIPMPDTSVLDAVSTDLHSEISLILGLPISWVAGKQKVGLGDSGDADARAIDRGLEPYFWESIHPAFQLLFGTKLVFKPESAGKIETGLEVIKAFDLASDTYLSAETKRTLVAKAFDLDPEEEAKRIEKEAKQREDSEQGLPPEPEEEGGDDE